MPGTTLATEDGKAVSATNPLPVTASVTVGAVTIVDGGNVAQGAKADTAVQDASSSASEISLLKGLQAILGLVTASPTANTVNDRLKALNTSLGLLGTQVTSAAILAKLSSDPATQTTLAAILALLPTALTASGNLKVAVVESVDTAMLSGLATALGNTTIKGTAGKLWGLINTTSGVTATVKDNATGKIAINGIGSVLLHMPISMATSIVANLDVAGVVYVLYE